MLVRAACITILTLCLSCCGFQLRKPNTRHLDSVSIQFASNCPKFENQLHSYFQSYNIKVWERDAAEDVIQHSPALNLECPVLTEQPLVYDGKGQLRRERLKLSLNVTIHQQPTIPLSIMRERQLNSNQSLADNAEKNLIIEEMQESLLYQLLSQIGKV